MPGGRPKAKIDKEQLEKLAEKQWSIEQIAAFFRVSRDTIERRFAANIKEAKQRGTSKFVDALVSRALGGRVNLPDGSIKFLHSSDRLLIYALDRFLGPIEQTVKVSGGDFVSIDRVVGGQVVGETILHKKHSDG